MSEPAPLRSSANLETSLAWRRWLAVLAKAQVGELEAAWDALADKPRYRVLRRAETGLVMLRGPIGGTGQPFNLGEMTMTRAAVQLVAADGEVNHAGFGHVAGRSARHALFDALLQDPARHDALAATLAPLRSGSETSGSDDFTPLWSGQAARLGRELPAGELTVRLAERALTKLGAL